MSGIDSVINAHVSVAYLKSAPCILADERDKKKFLRFVLQSLGKAEGSMIAFVVLDDEAYLMMKFRTDRQETGQAAAIEAAENYGKYCEKMYQLEASSVFTQVNCSEVSSMEEVLDRCRDIHRLPVERGYVRKTEDYWWSSFQTYSGNYLWEGLDTWTVLCYLKEENQRPKRRNLKRIS